MPKGQDWVNFFIINIGYILLSMSVVYLSSVAEIRKNKDIVKIYKNYDFKTKVLVASIRHPRHVIEAAKLGADICTMPPAVLEQLIHHPLTDSGMKKFMEDWDKVKDKQ